MITDPITGLPTGAHHVVILRNKPRYYRFTFANYGSPQNGDTRTIGGDLFDASGQSIGQWEMLLTFQGTANYDAQAKNLKDYTINMLAGKTIDDAVEFSLDRSHLPYLICNLGADSGSAITTKLPTMANSIVIGG